MFPVPLPVNLLRSQPHALPRAFRCRKTQCVGWVPSKRDLTRYTGKSRRAPISHLGKVLLGGIGFLGG